MSRGQFRDLVLSGDRRRSSFSGSGILPDFDNTFFVQLGQFSQVSDEHNRFDDDIFDRINYKYSSLLLVMSIGLLTIRQNIGKPIQCWVPQEFTQGWEEYTENYCWVSNTYFHPFTANERNLPRSRQFNEIRYYQWIPVLLGLQSLFFSAPCFFWRYISGKSGIDLQKVLKIFNDGVNTSNLEEGDAQNSFTPAVSSGLHRQSNCPDPASLTMNAHSANLPQMTKMLHSIMTKYANNSGKTMNVSKFARSNYSSQSSINVLPVRSLINRNKSRNRWTNIVHSKPKFRLRNSLSRCWKSLKFCSILKRSSSWSSDTRGYRQTNEPFAGPQKSTMTLGYLLTKTFYLINVIGQLYMMKSLIGNGNWLFGVRTLYDLIKNHHWLQSGNFPRVSFCDFETKKVGKNHKYTIQCVLPMNMFVEKIYTFLWFWFMFLLVVNLFAWIIWMYRLFIDPCHMVKRCLQFCGKAPISDQPIEKFVKGFLTMDLLFVIYLVKINIGDLISSGIVEQLWAIYYRQCDAKDVDDIRFSNYFGIGSRVPSLMINDQLFNPPTDDDRDAEVL